LPSDVVHPSRDQRHAAGVDGGDQVFGALYGRRLGAAQALQEVEGSGGGQGGGGATLLVIVVAGSCGRWRCASKGRNAAIAARRFGWMKSRNRPISDIRCRELVAPKQSVG